MTPRVLASRMSCFLAAVILVFSGVVGLAGPASEKAVYDILFVNGKILDGTGNPWSYGDVAVKDGRIAAVGKLRGEAQAAKTIDIKGKILAPGFIDIHTHAYDNVIREDVWTGTDEARFGAPNYVSQGVTTVVSNSCGYGPPDLKLQREVLVRKGTGPNVLLMIGHNAVRRAVMGADHRRPARPEEVEKMAALVRRAMEEGAAGMSSGLEYVPAIWSTKDEIVSLVRELVPFDGVYMAHERSSGLTPMWHVPSRDKPGPPTMIENIQELIEVSEEAGARVVASHIKARGADFWGASGILIRMINEARARGVDIWADAYPYTTSGSDGSAVLLPDWAVGRSPKENLEAVLRDPEKVKALETDIRAAINWRGGAENILVMDYPHSALIGKSLGELARSRGLSAVEMAVRLQLEGFPHRPGGARLRGFSLSEADIEAFYRQPWVATSSDGSIALPGDGPVHARFYGTFPRKIHRYAMERSVLSVENAVRSMTSLPAAICGLRDRGMVREGLRADLVVFDPSTIGDTATFFEPHQYAAGIEFVLVSGTFVVEAGRLTGKRPGTVLTRR
ncbi:MAG: amidohydrolase family protein [Candidatus Aminicenantes bacterium]|nr:amidohydrolase family protein [Candidatus Aminicenantes bacterium]